MNVSAKIEVRSFSLSVPEIIAIEFMGGGCKAQPSWGKGGRRGRGALVSSYRPSIVTFPLSLRV